MAAFYFIRHGETKSNESGILQGYLDIPLGDTGKKQAEALGGSLKDTAFDAIYASDLSRAYDTATAIAKHRGLPVIKDPRLREINCGLMQGRSLPENAAAFPEAMADLQRDPLNAKRPGGESYKDLYERVKESFFEIEKKHLCGNVAIVAHGGTIRCLLAIVKGVPVNPKDPTVGNCSISVAEKVGPLWTVLKENDVAHLLDAGLKDPRDKAGMYSW